MTYQIKFGTDGWREIIADNYTVDNLLRVTEATAKWIHQNFKDPVVTLGYDCRFGGKMFAEFAARSLAKQQIKVLLSPDFVTTPMISLANPLLKAVVGVIITASHNPPAYNGYKLKASYGGPVLPEEISEVENLIIEIPDRDLPTLEEFLANGKIVYTDFEKLYLDRVYESFDMDKIREISGKLIYDTMFGTGQSIGRKLFPNATFLNSTFNPSFNGVAPEPILQNLKTIAATIETTHGLEFGLATDGDADRIGFFDSKGNFIDSHHLILLITHYLVAYKNMSGKVVKSFSVSNKVDKLAQKLGLETITTKIGFKYICKHMVEDDVLIGAEESGGLAIKGHVPERDGIWMGLVLMEYMATTGKSVEQLVHDIYTIVGPFAVERYDLKIDNNLKNQIIQNCIDGKYTSFGGYQVKRTEDLDGFKYHFAGDEWVLIRPSGTEPVLRIYAESFDSQNSFAILDAVKATILG